MVGTLGVAGYLEAAEQVRKLAHTAGKKTYTLLMGKPSPVKLANFPEIDIFVLIADAQVSGGLSACLLIFLHARRFLLARHARGFSSNLRVVNVLMPLCAEPFSKLYQSSCNMNHTDLSLSPLHVTGTSRQILCFVSLIYRQHS